MFNVVYGRGYLIMHGHSPTLKRRSLFLASALYFSYNDALAYNVAVLLVGSLVIPGILVSCFTLQCPQLWLGNLHVAPLKLDLLPRIIFPMEKSYFVTTAWKATGENFTSPVEKFF